VKVIYPFTTFLDLDSGLLDPQRDVLKRQLSDLRGMFAVEPDDFNDAVVYHVYAIPVPETNSNILCSTTVIEPGDVAGEYYMTKGHFHAVRDRSEVYLGLSGTGRLLLATEDGRWSVEPVRRGAVTYVPGGWAHRTINIGTEPLIFFAAYVGDAGHDYGTIEAGGFPVRVMKGHDGPKVVPNPYYER
jgi:glucose-6-phosphate isomerase